MFSFIVRGGMKGAYTIMDTNGQIKFNPPVHEQRFCMVINIIEEPRWTAHFKKVVDFGCGEMRLMPLLKQFKNIEHILEVDIDEDLLRTNKRIIDPLVMDYVNKREKPLRVDVLKGSIDASVEILRNVDAVIGIEVIEHLYQNVLDKVPENIFGFMQPKLAVFTTPNSDYNVLFGPLLANGMRHLDHKFEWTREQFKEWALSICQRYPNYKVHILGVGSPPPGRKEVGYVTQIAIFARRDILDEPLVAPIKTDIPADVNPDVQYKEICSVDYPFDFDERTTEQKIIDETHYQIRRCRQVERYFNRETRLFQVPLTVMAEYAKKEGVTEEKLRTILLSHNINLQDEYIILPEEDEDDMSFRRYDDCFDDEYGIEDEFWPDEKCDAEQIPESAAKQCNADESSDECWD